MDNRIDVAFRMLKESSKKALIPFITAGDPDLIKTYDYVLALAESGADIIELGIPFSDPVAEGPVIQSASERALKNGIRTGDIFKMVQKLRETTQIPILFMMYVNCIYRYGRKRFFEDCLKSGVDGVIVPDLPYEEQKEILPYAEKYGLHSIFLVAPTSGERVRMIAEKSQGFLYCVSSTGVTGVRNAFSTDFQSFSDTVKKSTSTPAAVGFGIAGPEQAKELGRYFDGVIMGSAFVKIIGEQGAAAEAGIRSLASATRRALDSIEG